MAHRQLVQYIQKARLHGTTDENIRVALLQQGWETDEIFAAFAESRHAIAPPAPPKKTEWGIELKHLSASQILLYLGGVVVVLAAIIYVGINWSSWGPGARITAIFLPMAFCYAIGAPLWSRGANKKFAAMFVAAGALMFPFFLITAFKELDLFASPFNKEFILALSLASAVFYFIMSFVFRIPIWAFLYLLCALFAYAFLWRVIGVAGFYDKETLPWLMLIPATLYIFLALFYERARDPDAAHYANGLGALTLLVVFMRLFAESLHRDGLTGALVLAGALYFGLGAWFELRRGKTYCQPLYFVGAGVVFFALWRLARSGIISGSHDMIGWSTFAVGIIYLILAGGVGRLAAAGLKEGSRYKDFFDFVGPFFVLGSILELGTGGKKPSYETLLLLGSLAFIFGSIPKKSKQFLYIGTLFLVIFIFMIGGEYFKNDVGWPLTLFAAGLLSMIAGVLTEHLRRRYFPRV